MSWLFGRKKVRDSPPDSGEEASSSTSHIDDYILVERQTNPPSSIVGGHGNDTSTKSFGLYPFLPQDQSINASTLSSNISQMDILCDAPRYLHCIKFQLNKTFETDIEIDRLHADEIFSFILRIKSEDYDYDFSLETSVINEMVTSTE
ncbi:uncharacterized protein LOC107046189 [Diachasma alloeum]|uniref:uncharacterized protein LOC107046189 n=1 Tax=Diachasma alloeum TaxID=454923 RepID=UPI0007381CA0|nr:uncharacterized protein LOC107046189 [Diachasma alloeum]